LGVLIRWDTRVGLNLVLGLSEKKRKKKRKNFAQREARAKSIVTSGNMP
jgi:hypothetical protein